MEPAVFINARAAQRCMGSLPWYPGRTVRAVPVYRGRALQGYHVLRDGLPITEEELEQCN